MTTNPRPDETEADRCLAEAAVLAEFSAALAADPEAPSVTTTDQRREELIEMGALYLGWILEIDARAKVGR